MLNVVCLKHGSKYTADYVNRLYNMIQRHLTIPHDFYCFTENPADLNPAIKIKTLPQLPLSGWWWKPYIFSSEHFTPGDTNFYIDLDMVIVDNIDKLINYEPGKFVGLRDVGRKFNPKIRSLGSAVLKWPAGQYNDIWSNLTRDPNIIKQFRGDQNYIFHLYSKNIEFYPDPWILSYKWEVRNRSELIGVGETLNFKTIANPAIPNECSILAFHGNPRPHRVTDPVILNNWI